MRHKHGRHSVDVGIDSEIDSTRTSGAMFDALLWHGSEVKYNGGGTDDNSKNRPISTDPL